MPKEARFTPLGGFEVVPTQFVYDTLSRVRDWIESASEPEGLRVPRGGYWYLDREATFGTYAPDGEASLGEGAELVELITSCISMPWTSSDHVRLIGELLILLAHSNEPQHPGA